jgi:hypothetical protein
VMRRMRKDETKVWHNPELAPFARAPKNGGTNRNEDKGGQGRADKHHRAALEALFAPRPSADGNSSANGKSNKEPTPKPNRVVAAPAPRSSDPRDLERQKLLGKLLSAEGRPQITKAANDFLGAGFTFPDDQDVHLKLLEHSDEAFVRDALGALMLAGDLPKRRAVLESRLRRIEEFAEEQATREAAAQLRRKVSGRSDSTNQPTS